jgi:RNA polymerase sigma-70 factor (sigma-E family)
METRPLGTAVTDPDGTALVAAGADVTDPVGTATRGNVGVPAVDVAPLPLPEVEPEVVCVAACVVVGAAVCVVVGAAVVVFVGVLVGVLVGVGVAVFVAVAEVLVAVGVAGFEVVVGAAVVVGGGVVVGGAVVVWGAAVVVWGAAVVTAAPVAATAGPPPVSTATAVATASVAVVSLTWVTRTCVDSSPGGMLAVPPLGSGEALGKPRSPGTRRTGMIGAVVSDRDLPGPPSDAPSWSDADGALTAIYAAHYRSLVRLASFLLRDPGQAEEVVQDAFVAMHGSWRRLRDPEKAESYLRQAVVNKSRSGLRRRKVEAKHAPKATPDAPSAEYGALGELDRSAVIDALRLLPRRQREVLVLRYYGDLSEAQIAETLGISPGAVKSHASRGMSALRTTLEPWEKTS